MFESKWFWLGAVIGLAWILFSRCERDAARLGIGAGVGPGNRVGPASGVGASYGAVYASGGAGASAGTAADCGCGCSGSNKPTPQPTLTPLNGTYGGGPSGYGTRPGFGNAVYQGYRTAVN